MTHPDDVMTLSADQWQAVLNAPAGSVHLLEIVEQHGVPAAWAYIDSLTTSGSS